MNFNNLVEFIRSQGCGVKVCANKKKVDGVLGVFREEPAPHIKIAIKNRSKRKVVSLLLHEYAHFCQWRDGFSKYFDGVCWGGNLLEEWLEGEIELTERELGMVRATMLSVEYDAEIRAIEIARKIKPKNFDEDYHYREAHSYITAIKWAFKHRKDWDKRPSWKLYPAKNLTHKELFAPLTRKEKKILKGIEAKR